MSGASGLLAIGGIKMRPLILISSLDQGGAEQVTVGFLRHLSEAGSPVPLCTLTDRWDGSLAQELSEVSSPRYDLGARRLLDPLALLRLGRVIRQAQIDVVHAHGQDAAIMASWARVFTPFRLVITRHVMDEAVDGGKARVRAFLALRAMEKAEATVAVSQAVAARLTVLSRIPEERIRVIPNGIVLERFDRARLGRKRTRVRRDMGVEESESVVLFPAVLRPGKGHEVLLRAIPAVLAAFPMTRFFIAGDGELRGELEEAAGPLGAAVQFLGNRDDIPELMSAADLVVLPSLQEAFPTVPMEAAAAGRAIVASRVGGVSEVVSDGVTGLLVPPAAPGPLSQAIVKLLGDKVLRKTLASAGHQRALRDFGIERQAVRTVRLWSEIVNGGGGVR